MKLGKVRYLGSCLNNQGGMIDCYARKISVKLHYLLPKSIIVVNGTKKPTLNLVDMPSNWSNLRWNDENCLKDFVRTNIWAFSNTKLFLTTKQNLMSCCEANNIERVGQGLHEIKYNLKFWILCDHEGNVYNNFTMNALMSKLPSTSSKKTPTLSSYSQCLPLP